MIGLIIISVVGYGVATIFAAAGVHGLATLHRTPRGQASHRRIDLSLACFALSLSAAVVTRLIGGL